MKSLVLILTALMFTFGVAYAEPDDIMPVEEEMAPQSICPFTLVGEKNSCLICHELQKVEGKYKWGIRETKWRNGPYGVEFHEQNGEDCAYYVVEGIVADKILEIFEYCRKNDIHYITLEINSPGGSVVEAWRIIGIMATYPDIHVTTKCMGMAASAGFILLASADHRIASPRAMLMAHELWTLKFLSIETPAASKDEAETMALWQNNINEWLAEHSNLTAEEISEKIHKIDWWMIGSQAHEMGFVDELLWENEVVTEKGE